VGLVVRISRLPEVVYVDKSDEKRELVRSAFAEKQLNVATCPSYDAALIFVREGQPRVIAARANGDAPEAIGFLAECRRRQPTARRVLQLQDGEFSMAAKAVNSAGVDRLLDDLVGSDALIDVISTLCSNPDEEVPYERLTATCFDQAHQIRELSAELSSLTWSHETAVVEVLMTAQWFRHDETRVHAQCAAAYGLALGRAMGLSDRDLRQVEFGSLLHDIGKIGIPDSVLLKPGPLTDEEWVEMKTHPEIGYNLLNGVPGLEEARVIVYQHHERFDGRGYPNKLSGDEIEVGARIVSVVDSLDAMTTDRPYKKSLGFDAAWDEVLRCGGSQFDPEVVASFEDLGRDFWRDLIRDMKSESPTAEELFGTPSVGVRTSAMRSMSAPEPGDTLRQLQAAYLLS